MNEAHFTDSDGTHADDCPCWRPRALLAEDRLKDCQSLVKMLSSGSVCNSSAHLGAILYPLEPTHD